MATMYKRVNGSWVAFAPHIYGDAEIIPKVSTVNNMQIRYTSNRWQTSAATGPHLNVVEISSYQGSVIRIGYASSIPLTFFYGTSTGRNQQVFMMPSGQITKETIDNITYYTFTLLKRTYLFICQGTGSGTAEIYTGVIPSSIAIKGSDKQWNSGDVYKSANNIWS